MIPETLEKRMPLPGLASLAAVLKVARAGQCDPAISDRVQVRGGLELPAIMQLGLLRLHPALRFGARVGPVMGQKLAFEWGEPTTTGVALSNRWSGDTWEEAFDLAFQSLEQEVEPLLVALAARHAALLAAE